MNFEEYKKRIFAERPDVKREYEKLVEPLNVEQLNAMDGEPVWVEFEDGSGGLLGIVHITVFRQIVFPNGLHCTIGKPYYGRTYKAYRYQPVATNVPKFEFGPEELNINVDAWEPCVECKTCRNCKNQDDYNPYEGTTGECGQCYDMSNFYPVNFCHECGKPMTEEARTMLEKRLRGVREWLLRKYQNT